jgi:hypothetical protein
LFQYRQSHGDVKPVDDVFAVGMQILLHSSHIFAAVRHEYHLLVLLHPLRLHQLPEAPPRLLVVGLHKTEAFRRWHRVCFRSPERHHTPTSDHLKTALFVGCPNISAVNSNRHGAIRQGWLGLCVRSCELTELAFLAQFALDALGYGLQMFTHAFMLVVSPTGSTSCNKSATLVNGIREAHLGSR